MCSFRAKREREISSQVCRNVVLEVRAESKASLHHDRKQKLAGNSGLAGCGSGFGLFWLASLKSSPVEGILIVRLLLLLLQMGHLDYSTPTPGKDEAKEGAGSRSAYFLKEHKRG